MATPSARLALGMVYNAFFSKTQITAGYDENFTFRRDTWLLDHDGTWTQDLAANLFPIPADNCLLIGGTPAGLYFAVALDDNSGNIDFIQWDSATDQYAILNPATTPVNDNGDPILVNGMPHTLWWDSNAQAVFMYGGTTNAVAGSTWKYDPLVANWAHVVTAHRPTIPSTQSLTDATYMAASGLLIGTVQTSQANNGTWKFDGVDWTKLSALPVFGSAIFGLTTTYDSANDRIVGFQNGGGVGTYVYTLAGGWVALTPAVSPPDTSGFGMAYDPVASAPLIFGGLVGGVAVSDTWWFDSANNTWAQTPPVAPTVSSFLPASGPVGTPVTITGAVFTGATNVQFNGTPVPGFTVVDDQTITTTVPAGATTGTVSVTTPFGTGTSAGSFTVTAPPVTHPDWIPPYSPPLRQSFDPSSVVLKPDQTESTGNGGTATPAPAPPLLPSPAPTSAKVTTAPTNQPVVTTYISAGLTQARTNALFDIWPPPPANVGDTVVYRGVTYTWNGTQWSA